MRINQRRYISVVAFITILVALLATELVSNTFLGLNKYYWAVIVAAAYLVQNYYEYLKDYNYIYYNDEDENKILFRYISLRPLKNKRYSIEINKNQFQGYKVERPSALKQVIILYIKTPQGVAKYPPISISALSEDEFNNLKHSLNRFVYRQNR